MPSYYGGTSSGGGGGGSSNRGADRRSSPRRDVMSQGGGSPSRLENAGTPRPVPVPTPNPVQQTKPVKSKEELASEKATQAQLDAIEEAKAAQKSGFQTAAEGLAPYAQIGGQGFQNWASNLSSGKYTPEIKPFQYQEDPGYQFRMQQGQDALQSSAAVRGGALSGAALKELAGYGQQMASQEYGQAYNRYMQGQQLGMQAGQQSFAQDAALANIGLGTQQQLGNIGMAQGGAFSDLALQKGNVQAAGAMAPIDIQFQQQQLANQKQAMQNKKQSGLLGALGTAIGGLGGFLLAGPAGAVAGAGIGNNLTRGY